MNLLTILLSLADTLGTQPYGFYGPYSHGLFFSAIGFALIGHALVTFFDVATRDVHSPETPVRFSWSVLLECNWKRIVRNGILIFLAVRFCPEISGKPLSDFAALGVGASIDAIFVLIKNLKNNLPKEP